MGSLTDVQIKQWIKAKEPVAKADGEGLTFTLSASGRAAWILRYRIAGKAKEKTLGQPPVTLGSRIADCGALFESFTRWAHRNLRSA